jgi:hypothetical protein
MHRSHGDYVPTHRPLPLSTLDAGMRRAAANRRVAGVTEPFMFTRLFLVTGIMLAGVALATLVSA